MLTPNVNLNGATVLVTGAAGFIGCNLVKELLNTVENINIVGFDSVNDYYDVSIKEYRLAEL
ncbi:MAG: NAD-dependent epimerase/dehydratase family protein, partial [Clostridia bacterium]|nr:NAD-dependent epimerase/dehydratase family protein [Clostridia bacterium]